MHILLRGSLAFFFVLQNGAVHLHAHIPDLSLQSPAEFTQRYKGTYSDLVIFFYHLVHNLISRGESDLGYLMEWGHIAPTS